VEVLDGARALARLRSEDMVSRGKRLSRSNIIGEQGELFFRQWALGHNLVANKVTTDIGVDFFCQLTAPVENSGSVEGQGPILAAQVKTVEHGEDARLILNRIDATDLLRQTHATCLFGIRLSDQSIRFQFLDRSFIDRLVLFLDGKNKQLTLSYKTLATDRSLFLRLLKRYTNSFEQMQLRIHLIQQRLTTGIPGSRFSVESTDEETLSKVTLPGIASAFSISPKAEHEVRLNFLREGSIDPEQQGVELHPAIGDLLRQTNSSRALVLSADSSTVRVNVRWEGATATEAFDYREFRTEKSFVHRSGLRITIDRSTVVRAGVHEHPMEWEVFQPTRPTPLSGSALVFFRLFQPGATIELQAGWEVPLETFGTSLTSLGKAVGGWPDLSRGLGLPMRRLSLGDLSNEEFSKTTWMLEALLVRGVPIGNLVNGFLVGPAADLPVEQVPTRPVRATVPIGLNWKDTGLVIWLDCEADAFLWKDRICGIRLKSQTSWRVQKEPRFQKSIYPEMWFAADWPAIPLQEGLGGASNWHYDGVPKHPFEANVRPVDQR